MHEIGPLIMLKTIHRYANKTLKVGAYMKGSAKRPRPDQGGGTPRTRQMECQYVSKIDNGSREAHACGIVQQANMLPAKLETQHSTIWSAQ